MKRIGWVAGSAAALAVLAVAWPRKADPADHPVVGELPKGWTALKTGEGPGSVWKPVQDKSAPGGAVVLGQISSEGANPIFNLCVMEGARFKDVDFAVAMKAVAGKTDQGGGPVWRYRDAANYYVARANPLEANYRVYKVVAGKRTQLGSANVEVSAGTWHTLRVVHQGDHIQCYLNGKLYLDLKDGTFQEQGKVGLWTKADAQTYFAAAKVNGQELLAAGRAQGPANSGEKP